MNRHLVRIVLAVFLVAASGSERLASAQVRETPYFEFQVTKAVQQAPGSPSPHYPDSLKLVRVAGEVLVSFIVDTLGRAEVGTFKVLRASHPLFAAAVHEALPSMRFIPAELNGVKVRQLAMQPFVFALENAEGSTTLPALPAPPPPQNRFASPLQGTPAPKPPAGTVDGWIVAMRMTTDTAGGAASHTTIVRWWFAKGETRTERTIDRGPVQHSITLLHDTSASMTSLTPENRQAMLMPSSAMNSMFPASFSMTPGTATLVSGEDLGAGEPMLGHATHHTRATTAMTTTATLNGGPCTRRQETTTEAWTAADVPSDLLSSRVFENVLPYLFSDSVRRLVAATSARAASFPMRSISRTIRPAVSGLGREVKVTTDVTELTHGPIDRAVFAIPEGYSVVDFAAQRARTKAMLDSLKRKGVPGLPTQSSTDSLFNAIFRRSFCDP